MGKALMIAPGVAGVVAHTMLPKFGSIPGTALPVVHYLNVTL